MNAIHRDYLFLSIMTQRDEIILRINHSILENEPDATAIVFGLYARGESKKDSDIGRIVSPLVLSLSDLTTRHNITPFYQNIKSEGR